MRKVLIFTFAAVMLAACNKSDKKMTNELITRIAEIEVNEGYLEEYLAADSWMQHLAIHTQEQPGATNEWLEPVSDTQYNSVQR